MLWRIDLIEAAGEDRDRAGGEGTLMRRGIDAAREARHHHEAGDPQIARQFLGQLAAADGGIARADHADRRTQQQGGIAAQRQQRRRILDGRERLGIARLAQGQEQPAEAGEGGDLIFGLRARGRTQDLRAARPCQIGQSAQGLGRAVEAIQQPAKGDRPDAEGPRQPQPVGAFGIAQGGFAGGLHGREFRVMENYRQYTQL
jgi:hypothetical protein